MSFDIKEIKLDEFSYPWYEQAWDFVYRNKHFNIGYAVERIIKNFRFYKNVLRFDYDFDAHGMLRMMAYKLHEVERCLKEDKFHDHDPKTIQALRLATKLAKRLDEENYDERMHRHIEAKYGELEFKTLLVEGKDYFNFQSSYGGRSDKEYLDKVHAEERIGHDVAEKCLVRDERNLYAILLKYRRGWWS